MRATIPEEIKQARWIVKERQEMLAEAKREAERYPGGAGQGRRDASRRDRRIAHEQAEDIVERGDAARSRDGHRRDRLGGQMFGTLETNLDKFLNAVSRGRERLHERSQESVVATFSDESLH